MKKKRPTYRGKLIYLVFLGCFIGSWVGIPLQSFAQDDLLNWSPTTSVDAKIATYFAIIDDNITRNPRKATAYLSKVRPMVVQLNEKYRWGEFYELKGKMAVQGQNSANALKNFLTAAEYFKGSHKYLQQSEVFLALANIYHQQLNYTKALEYYELGLAFLQGYPRQNLPIKVRFLLQIGRCNLKMKRFSYSLSALESGKKLANNLNLPFELCDILFATGQNFQEQKQYDQAISILKKAQKIANAHHFDRLEMNILDALCRVSLHLEKINSGITYALHKKRIATQLQDLNCINISKHKRRGIS